MRVFLDTNVLFDYISRRLPYHVDAQTLVVMKAFGDIELVVSGKSYTDVFYILKRQMDAYEVQASIKDSLDIFEICSLEADDIKAACELGWSDFEDALIEISARKVGVDYLVTRDGRFAQSHVDIKTPRQIIEMFEQRGLSYAEAGLDSDDFEVK